MKRLIIAGILFLISAQANALLVVFECGMPKYILGEKDNQTVFLTWQAITHQPQWNEWFTQELIKIKEAGEEVDRWHEEELFNTECKGA